MPAGGVEPALLTPREDRLPLIAHMEYLEDPTGQVSLEAIITGDLDGQFKEIQAREVNFGFTTSTYWFRFTLRNDDPEAQQRLLELTNPRIDVIEFFAPTPDGTYARRIAGNRLPFTRREVAYPNPVLHVTTPPEQEATYYFRITYNDSFRFVPILWASQAFGLHQIVVLLALGIFFGSTIVMALYHLIVYISLREVPYLLYVLFIVSFALFQQALGGLLPHYGMLNNPVWISGSDLFFFSTTMLAAIAFGRSFLKTRVHAPRMDKGLLVLFAIGVIYLPFAFSGGPMAGLLSYILGFILPIYLFFIALICLRDGYRPARFWVGAWTFLLVGTLLFAAIGLRWAPTNIVTENAMPLGFLGTVVLFALALADETKLRLAEHQQLLEEKVRERTQDLQNAMGNIKTLRGLIPICSVCKKVRDDQGYWKQVESYVSEHSEADFTHSYCPDCAKNTLKGFGRSAG